MQFQTDTLPKATAEVFEKIKTLDTVKSFYLSGGTALSLQLGHRESEDLDFFSEELFNPQLVQQDLLTRGELKNVMLEKGTINAFMDTVKLQFLHYPYNLLEPLITWNTIYLSSVLDIACTKLITISSRGSKKDFIDLYFILQKYTLEELLTKLDEKYKHIDYNKAHIVKSLIYFDDGEAQPMPRMHNTITWDEVKADIIKEVKKISF